MLNVFIMKITEIRDVTNYGTKCRTTSFHLFVTCETQQALYDTLREAAPERTHPIHWERYFYKALVTFAKTVDLP